MFEIGGPVSKYNHTTFIIIKVNIDNVEANYFMRLLLLNCSCFFVVIVCGGAIFRLSNISIDYFVESIRFTKDERGLYRYWFL